jgi:glucan 1,3-beta-glucosidase
MLGSSSSSSSSSQEQATAVVGGSGGGGGTSPLQQNNGSNRSNTTNSWIRGVNLGGWLVLERYIVPYQFAVTDCHLRGDFCWYPGAASAPPETDPNYRPCDANKCRPAKIAGALGGRPDYPVDEATLAQIFLRANDNSTTAAERWFNYHFDNFIGREDLAALRRAGVTHVRVPLPHWILGTAAEDDEERDKWIVGDRWRYFVRACRWAREIGLQVWPDIHTAPGSQNGFGAFPSCDAHLVDLFFKETSQTPTFFLSVAHTQTQTIPDRPCRT